MTMKGKSIAILFAAVLAGAVLATVALQYFRRAPLPAVATSHKGANEAKDGPGEGGGEEPGGHTEKPVVRLTEAQRKEFGIEIGTAGPGTLKVHVVLPGEVTANADRLAHIVPPVPGIVREVRKSLGDRVRKGEAMAVLESRELADAKAAFLAASERVSLAQGNFSREEDLWKKRISAEQEYLQAKQALAEARIELRSAEQKLHALGFSEEYLTQLPGQPDVSYTRYEITAPFDGTVIEKHVSLGEALKEIAAIYTVADLSSVWVNLSIYQQDMAFVRKGQPVVISAGHDIQDMTGTISYLGPLVGEQTRTAEARVVLPNPKGDLRPGLFVTGSITVESVAVPFLIPKTALQTIEDGQAVFILTPEGFVPRPVTTGRSNDTHVEVTSGLETGERYAASGAFTLKAQLSKGAFGDGH